MHRILTIKILYKIKQTSKNLIYKITLTSVRRKIKTFGNSCQLLKKFNGIEKLYTLYTIIVTILSVSSWETSTHMCVLVAQYNSNTNAF